MKKYTIDDYWNARDSVERTEIVEHVFEVYSKIEDLKSSLSASEIEFYTKWSILTGVVIGFVGCFLGMVVYSYS